MEKKIEAAWFIMVLWQTGNIGPYNISKLENHQPKKGFPFEKEAENKLIQLLKEEKIEGGWFYHYTVMKLYY